jgi:HEAT repeat protein
MFFRVTEKKVEKWEKEKNVKKLLKALEDKDIGVKASEALNRLGYWESGLNENKAKYYIAQGKWEEVSKLGEGAVIPLIGVFFEKRDPNSIENSIGALVKIGEPAVEHLIEVFKNKYYNPVKMKDMLGYNRGVAARALAEIGDERAVEPLIKALDDMDRSVKRDAYEALVRIGDSALDTLIKALKRKNKYIRVEVAKILGEIKSERAIEPLINALKDRATEVRCAAARALWKIGTPEALEAARVFGKIGDKREIEQLIKALKDKDIRRATIWELEKIGDEKAVKPLIEFLDEDKENLILCDAVRALGEIGDERAVEPLIKKLKKGFDFSFQMEAVEALGKIGSEKATEPLINALNDDIVSLVARTALKRIGSTEALKALTDRKMFFN